MSRNLTRNRKKTFADIFEAYDADNEAVLDISTGYSYVMTVDSKLNPVGTSTRLFQVTGTIIDGPNGLVEFAPSTSNTDRVGAFYYEIEQTETATGRTKVVEDGLYIIKEAKAD